MAPRKHGASLPPWAFGGSRVVSSAREEEGCDSECASGPHQSALSARNSSQQGSEIP